MKPALCGIVMLLGFAFHAHAQVVTEMTPERIQEAIAKGSSGIYKLQERTVWGNGPELGYFTTPYHVSRSRRHWPASTTSPSRPPM